MVIVIVIIITIRTVRIIIIYIYICMKRFVMLITGISIGFVGGFIVIPTATCRQPHKQSSNCNLPPTP